MSADTLFTETGEPSAHARTSDPATSHRAAVSISSTGLAASEAFVVGALSLLGRPSTDEDIARFAAAQGAPFSSARLRTARKEAERHGRVRHVDDLGRSARGRSCSRWMAA